MFKRKAGIAGAALVAMALGAPAYAQTAATQPIPRPGVDNPNWNEQELRSGISVRKLIGMDVRGQRGNSIGEVQHVLLTRQGKVSAIVVESGGFANIGDTHFRIPFDQVKFGRDMDHAIVPLDEKTAEQMSEKRAREGVATGAGEFRMSRIDGVANLREGTRYGQLQDMIVSRNGDVKAVIVDTSFGPGGLRAIPFQSASFDFDRNVYNLPYGRDQVGTFRPFDYARYDVAAPAETAGTRPSAASDTTAPRGTADGGGTMDPIGGSGGDMQRRSATGRTADVTRGSASDMEGMRAPRPARN